MFCKHKWNGVRVITADGTKHYICETCRAFGRKRLGERKPRFWMTKDEYWAGRGLGNLI